jgi:hypothetical protein
MIVPKAAAITFLAGGVAAFGSYYYIRLERHQDIERLRQANASMRVAISETSRSRPLMQPPDPGQSAESNLQRARSKVDLTRDARTGVSAGKVRRWPMRTYRDAGQATPTATLQTMAWACDQGDVESMERLFIFDEDVKAKANSLYLGLPEGLRAEWRSVEAFAAAIIVHNGIEQPYPGSEVLVLAKIKPITAERVIVELPGAVVSGLIFQHTAEGWKYVISEAVVSDYLARRISSVPKL